MDGDVTPQRVAPETVMRAAAARRLGAARPPASDRSALLAVATVGLVFVVVAVVLAALRSWFWFWGTMVAITAMVVGPTLDWLFTRRRPESRLYEFDGGLVLSQPDEIVAFAWEDIEYVERALPPPGPHDGGPYAYSYRIRPRGGDFTTEIELPNGSNDQVAASIAAAALGRARELLAAGETVAFGRISVGPDGLTAGDRSLLWSEVGRVVRTSEFVRVYRRGRLQIWASAPIGDVPDARALVSLALERARTG